MTDRIRTTTDVPFRHVGPGMAPRFRCDRCQANKSTTGRKRWRGMLWVCRQYVGGKS